MCRKIDYDIKKNIIVLIMQRLIYIAGSQLMCVVPKAIFPHLF